MFGIGALIGRWAANRYEDDIEKAIDKKVERTLDKRVQERVGDKIDGEYRLAFEKKIHDEVSNRFEDEIDRLRMDGRAIIDVDEIEVKGIDPGPGKVYVWQFAGGTDHADIDRIVNNFEDLPGRHVGVSEDVEIKEAVVNRMALIEEEENDPIAME